MKQLIIRWIFVIGFLGFLYYLQTLRMLHRNQNLFMILLLAASGVVILGIVFFRDRVMTEEDEKEPEIGAMALLKKLEEENRENK